VGADDPNPTARATLFDVRTRRVIRELAGHSAAVQGIRFSADGRYVATSAMDGTVKLWSTDPPPAFISLEGHSQAVWTAAFSPNGSRIATGSMDQTARIWDATNGTLLRTVLVRFPVVSLAFSHDGERLATVGPANRACIWKVGGVTASGSKGRLPTGSSTSRRDPQAEPPVMDDAVAHLIGHAAAVMAVAWSPDDRWLATGGKDNTARIWDAVTGTEQRRLDGHKDLISAVAFSPDGQIVATGGGDGTARLWSVTSGQCLLILTNHPGGVLSVAFSPNGRVLATGGADAMARLWDTTTGRMLQVLSGHFNGVSSVAFSPDGQRLVTAPGGQDFRAQYKREARIFIWDVASGHQLLTLAHDNAIFAAAFSPDGRGLVAASGDNTARIWTAFPWHAADYTNEVGLPLAMGLEGFKRRFWRSAITKQEAIEQTGRSWTNWFHLYRHSLGEMNLPPAGSKTRPLFPIPPRPTKAGPAQLDLSGVYNVALDESWLPADVRDVGRNLARLPRGLQSLGGVTFDIRGMVQLRSAAPDSEIYPDRASMPVGRTFQRLHALFGTDSSEWSGREIGALELRFADGTVAVIPIQFGDHCRNQNWWGETTSDCPKARLAWGADPAVNREDWRPRLYQSTFLNPQPDREVVSLEFVSRVTRCGPFLVALTLE